MMRINRKGFTLMELLIVIAIIGLIAAIAAPRMGTTISDAKRSQFTGNFAVIRTAAMLMKAANAGYVKDPDPQATGVIKYNLDTVTTGLTDPVSIAKVFAANTAAAGETSGIWNYLDIREAYVYTEEDGGVGTFAIWVDTANADPLKKNKDFVIYCIGSDGTALTSTADIVWHSTDGWGKLATADDFTTFAADTTVSNNDMWEKARVK